MSEVSKTLSRGECGVLNPTPAPPASCLIKPKKNSNDESGEKTKVFTKEVSFPEDESQLVTGFMEAPNPWEHAENVDREILISSYSSSCIKHGHRPSAALLRQLEAIYLDGDRCGSLSLKGEILDPPHCESLEEVFKRVQFVSLDLEDTSLDDEGAVALFDMIEYYEAAVRINISRNRNLTMRGWQACSRMIKKMHSLEHLEARSVPLNEQFMPVISRALRITPHLKVLKLEDCSLSGRTIIILVAALKINTGLRELYLCDNDLGINDAIQLSALLRANYSLQLLDVSNNDLQDVGAGHIADGIADQGDQLSPGGGGLRILVLWNNRLTRNSSTHLARALTRTRSLEMLNIGHNMLSNEVLHMLKDSLQQNRTLLRLGMQSTHLTCEGAIALAEIIADNPVIQRIDLRDNNILVAGLLALALSLKSNMSVTQLDLDDVAKKKLHAEDVDEYNRLVREIYSYCTRNENVSQPPNDEDEELSELSDGERHATVRRMCLSGVNSRKISLTCHTLLRSVAQDNGMLLVEPRRTGGRLRSPAPSPVPSPVSSPMPSPSPSPGPARSRFRVSQVSESDSMSPSPSGSPSSSPTCFFPSSRFKVTVVEPPVPVIVTKNVPTFGFSCDDENDKSIPEHESEADQGDVKGQDKQIVGELTPEADDEVLKLMEGTLESDVRRNIIHPTPVMPSGPVSFEGIESKADPVPTAAQAPRLRKLSSVTTNPAVSSSSEQKGLSSLERLLGLFNNPGGLFNKTQAGQNTVSPPPKLMPAPSTSVSNSNADKVSFNEEESVNGERLGFDRKNDCDRVRHISGEPEPGVVASNSTQRDILNNNSKTEAAVEVDGPPRKDENLNITEHTERGKSRNEDVQECVHVQVRLLGGDIDGCDKHDCGDQLLLTQKTDLEEAEKNEDVEEASVNLDSSVVVPTVTTAPPIPTSVSL